MKKRLISIALLLVILLTLSISVVSAQTYLFEVDKTVANVYINQDGTMVVEYWFTFTNDPSASPIDYVDVGTPNDSYPLSAVTADINGSAVSVGYSSYVDGIEVALGSKAIRPGETGIVHVRIPNITNNLFVSDVENYASFNFMPNYFGSEYVNGKTDLTVTLYLPPGIEPDQPIYHKPKKWPGAEAPEAGYDDQNRVYYRWSSSEANSHTQYIFGASFPEETVPEDALQKPPSALMAILASENLICVCFNVLFFGIFGLVIFGSIRGSKKRKMKYLPPKIAIEGHGIKRGLTAVEAAVLLEQPVDKVITMILFSTIKKGAATVLSQDPLKLEVADPLPEKLHTYEKEFLAAFKGDEKKRRKGLQDMMVNLIKSVTKKIKGFSRKETITYYKDIMERAWKHVEEADTPEVKMEKFDDYMGWTMLDKDFDKRTERSFGSGPTYVPMWWGRYDPVYRSATSRSTSTGKAFSGGKTSTGTGRAISVPNLPGSNFAASVVNGTQAFAAGAIGNVTGFTSGITNKTNPVPVSTSTRSSGSSGGRSCACACACAGCACACAGGGR